MKCVLPEFLENKFRTNGAKSKIKKIENFYEEEEKPQETSKVVIMIA